jgi:hypothetical protein
MKKGLLFATAAFAAVALATSTASAELTIKNPDPPKYSVEIEPKLNLAYLFWTSYGGNAIGPGVRFSIPVMSPGFIKDINDSIAIGFGVDILHYDGGPYGYYNWYGYCNGNPKNCPGYYNGYDPSFWAVSFPVVMQWNFWLTDKWSVFGEPGLTIRHAFYPDYYSQWCGPGFVGTCGPKSTEPFFTFYAGGRYNFNEKFALTMRLGYPLDFSIGLSIFL